MDREIKADGWMTTCMQKDKQMDADGWMNGDKMSNLAMVSKCKGANSAQDLLIYYRRFYFHNFT